MLQMLFLKLFTFMVSVPASYLTIPAGAKLVIDILHDILYPGMTFVPSLYFPDR